MGPKSTHVLVQDAGRKQTRGRTPCEDGGLGWVMQPGAQDAWRPGSQRRRRGPRGVAGSALALDCAAFCCLSHQHVVLCPVALKTSSVPQGQIVPSVGLHTATVQTCSCPLRLGCNNCRVDGDHPGLVRGPRARGWSSPTKDESGSHRWKKGPLIPNQDITCLP